MEADYLARGWELTKKHSDADLIVVRGCSVTHRAEKDCEHLIEHLKRKYPSTALKVFGCLEKKKDNEPIAPSGTLPTRTARAYLKIQDGCSGLCTFCIVPKFRGKSVSEGFTEVIDKAKRFIDLGYREIVLTGCNLSLYASEGHRLPDLLAALPEGARYRLGSLEPSAAALEVVDVMSARADICRFLHIPIQSGSNRILTAMRRPYLIKDVHELLDKATTTLPMLGLGCDLITGFPSEMDVDFTLSRNLLNDYDFSNAHIFPFSARPGTIAAGLPDQISREVSHKRAHELSHIVKTNRKAFAKRFIGKTVKVVIEDEMKSKGWTEEYLPCEITIRRGTKLMRKDMVEARVLSTRDDVLKAVI